MRLAVFCFLMVLGFSFSGLVFADPPERDDLKPVMATAAPDANDVRPLLVGSTVPDVHVTAVSGELLSLRELVDGKPSLLLFYRGGW